ncbi:MAG TPA: extracellular solute-binding protein [Devosia sp.]|nr:extracellular solute-binding protein [Devosia sp.]
MKMRRRALIFAAAAAVASCAATVATAQDAISGTVSLWYLEDPDAAFMPAIKEQFEAKYPGTTVELTELPEDGFVAKIDTALLAQQPPDVSFIYESRWIKAGDVIPLEETIAQYGIDTSVMNQVALSECLYEGHLYCLGSLTGSVMLIYNKDLFDKAGVAYPSTDTPWTIDEYAAAARKLSAALDGVWGQTAGPVFTWADRHTHFNDDGTKIAGYVDDASTVHMYQALADLAKDGISPVASEGEFILPADLLAAGSVAMAITDTEYAAASMATAGYHWGVAPPPVEKAGDAPFVFVGTDKYGAFSDSKNAATARALVAFIATVGNELRVTVSDKPPLDSRRLPQWAKDDEGRKEVGEVLSLRSAPGLFVPGFWEVTAPIDSVGPQITSGELTAEGALKEQAVVMQEKLDREWQTWNEIQ